LPGSWDSKGNLRQGLRGAVDEAVAENLGMSRYRLEKLKKDGYSHLIKRIKQTTTGIDIESYDQHKALVDVGKHHELFTDNYDITSKGEKIFDVSIDRS